MSTKVKSKIIQNIEFDGDYNTISIIKNKYYGIRYEFK